MRPQHNIVGALVALFLLSLAWVPEALAFRGRGAAFVVGAAVGSSKAEGAEAEAAAAQQQAAASQQQAAAAQQQAATAQAQLAAEKEKTAAAQKEAEAAKKAAAPGPAVAAGPALPLGTVVAALPAGCTPTPVSGVNYYYCGGNFYQAVFEGSNLKYVTTKPK
jgi:nucleoid-associated protein YgaU